MPRTYVRPEGNPETALIALVGEQPGRQEIISGKPFVGPAGNVLNEIINGIGLPRSSCYITNVIKDLDYPLKHYISFSDGGTYSKEGYDYKEALFTELNSLKANVIIALGWVSLNALCDRPGIGKWRGSVLENPKLPGKYIIPSHHPATVLPSFKEGKRKEGIYTNKLLIQFDIKRGRDIAINGLKKKERTLIISPSFKDAIQYLIEIETQGLMGLTIDLDIELMNEEISCISWASNSRVAMSIPFIDSKGSYFSVGQEIELWKVMARILENSKIRKRGQYFIFDTHFLLRKYGIKTRNVDDTMVAQKIIMPDYPVGLDFITSIWTDQEYYKDEGKQYFSGGNWPKLWQYNCTDSLMCAEAFPKQLIELRKQDNIPTYNRQVRMIEPLLYMMERGIKIDVEGMTKRYNEREIEIADLREELNKMVGFELNANSPKQLVNHFYKTKGIKPYKKDGKVTTEEKAMVRIARKGYKEARKILEIRRAIKNRSTYLNPEKVDKDGRMRCSYNPVGTRYSRISSSKNIFGTGNNLQNQPHDVLQYFLADEGYVHYTIDLSQAENRIVAYYGKIPQMIECFETGQDVHSLTASMITGISVDEIKRQDKENVFCELGDGLHTWRFYGKKSDHSLNYDLGYKNFSLTLEIPEKEGKFLVERYHLAYPGIRGNYHEDVKKSLAKDRSLTNLFGRKTVFLGEWGDSLFKEAFSCIPQGTVGDMINEWGVEYIYYNQSLFAPIELQTQIHDSIGFQIPLSHDWEEHARMLRLIKNSLEQPLTLPNGDKFSIPVEIKMGLNMKDTKEVSPDGISLMTTYKEL